MNSGTTAMHHVGVSTHSVERIAVRLGMPYREAVTLFEQVVPAAPLETFLAPASWEAVGALLDATPVGFMRYGKIDSLALLAPSGATRPSVEYLVGDHAIAASLVERELAIVNHVPLRVVFHADDEGDAVFIFDRPSDSIGSFDDTYLTQVGRPLDGKLAKIIEALGSQPPTTFPPRRRVIPAPASGGTPRLALGNQWSTHLWVTCDAKPVPHTGSGYCLKKGCPWTGCGSNQ